jgi:hypothetical protein
VELAAREVSELLAPGEHFEGLEIVKDAAFARPARKPPRVTAVERFYARVVYAAQLVHEQGFAVTVDMIRARFPDLPYRQVQEVLESERFAASAEELGLPLSEHPGLLPEQMAALAIYLDTSTPATHSQKLRAAGVSQAKWRGWLRQPAFAARLQDVAGQLLQDSVPVAFQRIAEAVDGGERWAVELSLEMTGTHDRRNDGTDLRKLLTDVFNILDEEIADSAVLERIAAKIKQAMGQQAPVVIQQAPAIQE